MSTKHIERVAIVGATGRIGGAFAKALVQTGKHTVTALTRHDSKATLPDGVHPIRVDYNDDTSLVKALEGQQFLIITLSVRAPPDLHGRIAKAAGKAGVPYIMPNAFGNPIRADKSIDKHDRYGAIVLERVNEVRNSGSSSVTLPCGFWYEWSLGVGEKWFGFTIKDRKVTFFDDGKKIMSVSTWNQCGRAIAGLLSLPESGESPSLEQFKNKEVLIYSFRVSQRDMLDSLHRVLGTTDADWEISYEPTEKRIADGAAELAKGDFTGFAKMLYGGGFLPTNQESDFAGTMEVANDVLGLPKEDLDEATRRTVEMIEGGWNPFAEIAQR